VANGFLSGCYNWLFNWLLAFNFQLSAFHLIRLFSQSSPLVANGFLSGCYQLTDSPFPSFTTMHIANTLASYERNEGSNLHFQYPDPFDENFFQFFFQKSYSNNYLKINVLYLTWKCFKDITMLKVVLCVA
jgi:hypothetical protein